jgi:hypothetical protein
VFQLIEEILLKDESCWKMEDVIKIFRRNDFANLYKFAIELACENPEIVFESDDFLNIEEIYLIQLLKSEHLKLDEIKIWEYVINWGIKNTNSILSKNPKKWKPTNFMDLENTIHNCIPHIRFFQMSPDHYVNVRTYFKDILPDGLDKEVLQYFSNPYSILPFKVLPPRIKFDSNIINAIDAALIASWIDKKRGTPYHFKDLPIKFNLIYRASRDGFGIDKFHDNCDNKGPTVVIIKVQITEEIIGGYNPLGWCHVKDEKISENNNFFIDHPCETSESFIFSLTNKSNPRLSRVTSKKEAIIWCRNKGPCFAQDLCINPSPIYFSSYIIGNTIQKCYKERIMDRETFKIDDYEVFQVIDNRFSVSKTTKRMLQTIKWIFRGILRITKPVPMILFLIIKWTFMIAAVIIIAIVGIIYYYFIALYQIIKLISMMAMVIMGIIFVIIYYWFILLFLYSLFLLLYIPFDYHRFVSAGIY